MFENHGHKPRFKFLVWVTKSKRQFCIHQTKTPGTISLPIVTNRSLSVDDESRCLAYQILSPHRKVLAGFKQRSDYDEGLFPSRLV